MIEGSRKRGDEGIVEKLLEEKTMQSSCKFCLIIEVVNKTTDQRMKNTPNSEEINTFFAIFFTSKNLFYPYIIVVEQIFISLKLHRTILHLTIAIHLVFFTVHNSQ